MTMSRYYMPTIEELEAAHKIFEQNEPRDLFYRAATELVDLAIRGQTKLTLVEAVAVLLQTWNVSYYRFHGKFDTKHFAELERVIHHDEHLLMSLRQRTIASFTGREEDTVRGVFARFEQVLGPVGAAKSLHLLAPRFFPLWDRAIAAAYGLAMKKGDNADRYIAFMGIAQRQCREVEDHLPKDRNPLKALDEYNYIHFTKRLNGRIVAQS
ncbi:MAG: hypothetical protein ACLQUY_29120 [Ktedonobacterales bacterium]